MKTVKTAPPIWFWLLFASVFTALAASELFADVLIYLALPGVAAFTWWILTQPIELGLSAWLLGRFMPAAAAGIVAITFIAEIW